MRLFSAARLFGVSTQQLQYWRNSFVACHISVRTETKSGFRRELYRKSLGAEETLFTYWHVPAFDIELPLLAQIYHDGLEVRGELLDVLPAGIATARRALAKQRHRRRTPNSPRCQPN